MGKIEIYKDSAMKGECCWKCRLKDNNDNIILDSDNPLTKGKIIALAKQIKNECVNARLIDKEPENEKSICFQIQQAENNKLCLKLVAKKHGVVFISVAYASKNEVEKLLGNIKQKIGKAHICWCPPEADPAKIDKDADQTPTKGIPGS